MPGPKPFDLAGQRFGETVAVGRFQQEQPAGRRGVWNCLCDCGVMHNARTSDLISGAVHRCAQCSRKNRTTHAASKSPEYRIWTFMRQRCENPRSNGFDDYGARGIKVCERWRRFENFIADMGRRPSPELSLDRRDNNGNYEPGNCRWATRSTQSRNQRKRGAPNPNDFILGALSCQG